MGYRVFNREKYWKKAKRESIEGLSEYNTKILNDFLKDFELGVNVPIGRRGRRKPGTLLKLRGSVSFILKHFPKTKAESMTKKQLHELFKDMFEGKIKKLSGKDFRDVGDYVKNFKTFWGWMLRTGKVKEDITNDLSQSEYKRAKPSWVYLGNEKMRKLIDQARGDYRALILFLYDSGLRPEEAYKIKVCDFSDDYSLLNVPEKRENGDKVSKTFERTIKLKHSSGLIKNYVEINKLKPNDYLIIPNQPAFNKYLRMIAEKLFGNEITKARGTYNQLKLYDIRHNSTCYWLDKYKTNKDLMYRMGWKKEDKVLYYSEFLGRRDKIDDEDMMTKEDRTKMEKEMENMKEIIEMNKKQSLLQNAIIIKTFLHIKDLKPEERKKALELQQRYKKLLESP